MSLSELPPPRSMSAEQVTRTRASLIARIDNETVSRSWIRRRRGWISSGVATGAAVAAGVLVLAPQPAFASWTARPDAVGANETQALGTVCAREARESFPEATDRMNPVVAERRGDFRTVLIAGAGQISVCADWLGQTSGNQQRGGAFKAFTMNAELPVGQAISIVGVPGQLSGPDAVRFTYGLVSRSVTNVEVETADGRKVQASVGSGYFLAWWPSGAEIRTATARDGEGAALGVSR